MHPSVKQSLNRELDILLKHLEEQMDVVKVKAQELDMQPEQMMYANGHHVMIPLLTAQAQALNAKVHLNM